MAPVDIAWLRMDEPNNLMQINGVLALGGELDVERVRDLVSERLLRIRRFRQKVVVGRGGHRWEVDPAFDLDAHLVVEPFPAPGGRAE
ncbi:MAG: wax ester/triacylglycerol synthase family O-acyltransferase, partial [Thermoanaerobaculia bacterium]|nr:wax ester/triacylglycerol synthase family O-acyltransferase [Thermoanaerobaculia bacterium]